MTMNATYEKLLEILSDGITDQIRIEAWELACSVDLSDGQELTWLASSNIDGALVNDRQKGTGPIRPVPFSLVLDGTAWPGVQCS
jgi:hypothetical protein